MLLCHQARLQHSVLCKDIVLDAQCKTSSIIADITNSDSTLLKSNPADSAQLVALQARVKELEMEQSLMQHELDNMSEVAQRADKQLRYSCNTLACGAHCLCMTRGYIQQDAVQHFCFRLSAVCCRSGEQIVAPFCA